MGNGIAVLFCIIVLIILSIPLFLIYRKKAVKRKLWATIYVFILICVGRIFVGVFSSIRIEQGLNVIEGVFDSFVHALQTFSMDEDYTLYTVAGKELIEALGFDVWAKVYGFVISLLNIVAPILGGALLLDILTDVFPHVRLYLMPFSHKFVFSELNEASVCLAEDIYKNGHYKELVKSKRFSAKPLLLFTDAYFDRESEATSELFGRAKALGALCIKADLLHISLRKSKSVYYFLIDEEPHGNISSLSQLLDGNGTDVLWPETKDREEPLTKIFVFANEDVDSALINSICAKKKDVASKVLIRSIRDYMNAAINLMYNVPLFMPLLSKTQEERKDLFVTILGSGQIAEEAFKAAFWCGQMYGIQLHLNVLSKDAKALEQRITEKCPELLESCRENSLLLRTHPFLPDSPCNAPYSTLPHFEVINDAICFSEYPPDLLKKTDYFIVALGTDEQNLAVANELKLVLARQNLENPGPCHPVIAPAVFDSRLVGAVEKLNPDRFEPYVIPFATLEDRFSCKNVFMADFTEQAFATEKLYNKNSQKTAQKDEYTYWANLARAVHAPYKLFALGILQISRERNAPKKFCIKEHEPFGDAKEHEISWMEHRRWNAFLRTQGFSCPTKEQYDHYYQQHCQSGDATGHKSVPLKLHPCLVECQVNPEPLPESENFDRTKYDYLDYVTMYTYHTESRAVGQKETGDGLRNKNYKQWDCSKEDPALLDLLQ